MTPAVSIVMAAKNYARFLPMAVKSVLTQSFPNWELLIVDDGSTDDTRKAVAPFLMDSRIRYIASDCLGQSRAKNLGVRLCCAEFIAFLDADDAWLPAKLSKQLCAMQGDSKVGVVACQRYHIDESTLDVPASLSDSDCSFAFGALQEVSIDDVFVSNPICFSSVMVRRGVFDLIGGFDPDLDLSIDYDLWLRVAAHFRIVNIPEKLTIYRTGHGNLSKKQSDRIATAFTIMHRADRRKAPVNETARCEGIADTYRSLGWLYRRSEPNRSLRAYRNAFTWPNRRLLSLKGMLATFAHRLRPRQPLMAENMPENC